MKIETKYNVGDCFRSRNRFWGIFSGGMMRIADIIVYRDNFMYHLEPIVCLHKVVLDSYITENQLEEKYELISDGEKIIFNALNEVELTINKSVK